MEFQINAAGRRVYPSEFKKKILEEIRTGVTAHELSRKYEIPIQNVLYWKKAQDEAVFGKNLKQEPAVTESVPVAEYRRILEENKNLRKSLANMTMDRDILKDAVDIASKKKWI
jgi:transposase-like protein